MKNFGMRVLACVWITPLLLLVFYGCGVRQEQPSASPAAAVEMPQELPLLQQNELYQKNTQPKAEEENSFFTAFLEKESPKDPDQKTAAQARD